MHETERKYEYQNSAYSMKNGDYVVVKKKHNKIAKKLQLKRLLYVPYVIHSSIGLLARDWWKHLQKNV